MFTKGDKSITGTELESMGFFKMNFKKPDRR